MRIALAALSLAVAPLGAQQQNQNPPIPQIVTSGTGETTITPDRARIDIAVETRGATAAAASQENARISQLVQTRLRSLGLANERIATWGYNVHAEYDHRDGRARIIGYVARNTVRADVWRVDQVGAIIDGAVAAGANNINGIDFYSSSLEEARQRALAQAVARARADAQVMAAAAGGRLGDLIELSSAFNAPPPMPYMARMEMAAQADATPINPGERTVSASVNARWRFLPP